MDDSTKHEHFVAACINWSMHHSSLFGDKWKATRPQVDTKHADVRIDGLGGGIWVEVKMGKNDFLMNPRLGYQERNGKPIPNDRPNFPVFNGWYVSYDWNKAKNKLENSNSTIACSELLKQVSDDRNLKKWITNFKNWLQNGGNASRKKSREYWQKHMSAYFHMSSLGGYQRQANRLDKSSKGMVNTEDMKKFVKDLTEDPKQTRWREKLTTQKVSSSGKVTFGHVYEEMKVLSGVESYASQNLCEANINVPHLIATHYAHKADGGAYYMQAGHDFYVMPMMKRPSSKGEDPLHLNKKFNIKIPLFWSNASTKTPISMRLSNRSGFHEFMTEIKMNSWVHSDYSAIPCVDKINPFNGKVWNYTVNPGSGDPSKPIKNNPFK